MNLCHHCSHCLACIGCVLQIGVQPFLSFELLDELSEQGKAFRNVISKMVVRGCAQCNYLGVWPYSRPIL